MNVKEEGNMGISRKRLSILTKGEIEKLFGLPKFTYEDRLIYFWWCSEPVVSTLDSH